MIPKEPPRRPQLGFLYFPPYRVQGLSTAGEETVVQIPELDVCFDIGQCPRAALTSNYVALTHGHMDHAAGLAYYFSQREFQGMGVGTVICHKELEQPIHDIMKAWIGLERQRTEYKVIGLDPDEEFKLKNNTYLRGFKTDHTPGSLGFIVIERRSKLKPEFTDLPQEELVDLKKKGESITRTIEIPLVCYTGDTMWGPHFDRPDVLGAKILITECTFTDEDHRSRAALGKHLHLDDIAKLVEKSQAEAIVLTHLSRRTHLGMARDRIAHVIGKDHLGRVHVLMDYRANHQRYDRQARAAAEAKAAVTEPC